MATKKKNISPDVSKEEISIKSRKEEETLQPIDISQTTKISEKIFVRGTLMKM